MRHLYTALGALLAPLFLSMPVYASPEAHGRLLDAVEEVGITVLVNHVVLCDGNSAGMYSSSHAGLVICQDKRGKPNRIVEWTENDYDTIRHEAHHIIQDCIQGRLGDSRLDTVFDQQQLKEFVENSGMSESKFRWIVKTYRDKGLSDKDVMIELEAFAVAASISADTIAETLLEVCQ